MQQFLVDTNVFVSAIKNPESKAGALDLILELISNKNVRLVGNDLLLLEFDKYSERYESETASIFRKIRLLILSMQPHASRKIPF
ncbi:Uncharacterised protein [uncultured archaeon]|nr:Uncharacterised protein [uncultured archaeon]